MTTEFAEIAKQELEARKLARTSLKHFTWYTFGPRYRIRPYNELICDAVDLAITRRITRLMVFVPPQYGKSEIVSIRAPAYTLGRYPDTKLIATSYALTLVRKFSRQARDLIKSKQYRNVFPNIKLASANKSVTEWQLANYRGGVFAAGITGGITGNPADGIIIDDPIKDDKDALSEAKRDGDWEWFWTCADSRLAPDGFVILCLTRWHEDDLAGRLLLNQQKGSVHPWYVLRLPTLAEKPEETEDWATRHEVPPERLLTRQIVDELHISRPAKSNTG
jgi:hypothetical protein